MNFKIFIWNNIKILFYFILFYYIMNNTVCTKGNKGDYINNNDPGGGNDTTDTTDTTDLPW